MKGACQFDVSFIAINSADSDGHVSGGTKALRDRLFGFSGKVRRDSTLQAGLHCPLTSETRRMINATMLRQMRKEAILINTARGAIIDTDALIDALRQGVIAGAGIDARRLAVETAMLYRREGRLRNFVNNPAQGALRGAA